MVGDFTRNELFDDEQFWLTIDVDHPDAVEKSETEAISLSEELLDRFLLGKQKVVESRFESAKEFKQAIRADDSPKDCLLSVFAESLWMQSWNEGVEFEHTHGDADSLLSELGEDVDIQEVDDTFGIIWPSNPTIRREKQDGEVVGRRPNETDPVVFRKGDSTIKVRASTPILSSTAALIRSHDSINQVEPESADVEISGNIREFISDESSDMQIIGVKFNESELPERSRIRIKSERAIYNDLEALHQRNVISTEGVSAIKKLYLRDERYGGKYRIKVIHGNDGFRFELEAPDKSQRERKRFKDRFTQKTGVDFGVVYEYGSQNQRHLFNRTLSGDGKVYDRYYPDLEPDLTQYVDEFTAVTYPKLKLCLNCRHTVESDRSSCDECGGVNFSESFDKTNVRLNHERIAQQVKNRLSELSPEHEAFRVMDWSPDRRELNNRDVIRASFRYYEAEEDGSSTDTRHEVFFVPQGNQSRPGQVTNYLLKCVFMTYGDSTIDDYDGFGRIPLYELLTADYPDGLVGKAIHDAITGVQKRTFNRANTAYDEAQTYLNILSSDNAFSERVDELEEHYDPNNPNLFEKHVFYLLKGLFNQTERWGRHGKREADALLIIPQPGERVSYAAKVDAKISHREKGYELGTRGEDQASRYLANSEELNALRAKTGRDNASALIIISQNFNEDTFPIRARGVQDRLSPDGEGHVPDLVFMDFEALVKIYELEYNHYQELANPDIRSQFNEFVLDELANKKIVEGEEFVHFDMESISGVRDALIQQMDQYDYDPVKEYSD